MNISWNVHLQGKTSCSILKLSIADISEILIYKNMTVHPYAFMSALAVMPCLRQCHSYLYVMEHLSMNLKQTWSHLTFC